MGGAPDIYASDFTAILSVLSQNAELRAAVEKLIQSEPISGKALEGGSRLSAFRNVLRDLVNGRATLDEAYARTERDLPRPVRLMQPATWSLRKTGESVSCARNQASFITGPLWKSCAQPGTTGASYPTRLLRIQTLPAHRG